MYLAHKLTRQSLSHIGRHFNTDYEKVAFGVYVTKRYLEDDAALRAVGTSAWMSPSPQLRAFLRADAAPSSFIAGMTGTCLSP